jgi:hypothetical protein
MKRAYEKPSLKKAHMRLQAVTAVGKPTGLSNTDGNNSPDPTEPTDPGIFA